MAIQVRRGNEADFDASKMLPGECAVSLDTKYVRFCFSPGVCLRMATYEAFEEDMAKIESILEEAQTIEEAIEKLQTEINATAIEVENFANSAEQSAKEAKEYAEAAAESASKAEALTGPVVTGIKGSAETDFRTGQVTISPDNLGLGEVLENMLKAETLTTTSQFNITADTQADFFIALGQFIVDKGINLNETLHLRGVWANHFYYTVFCTYIPGNALEMLCLDNGGNVWTVNYSIDKQVLNNYFKLTSTAMLSNYLPLTGGALSNILYGPDFVARLNGYNYGRFQALTEGTEDTVGICLLSVGNALESGKAGNARAILRLHSHGSGFSDIYPTSLTSDISVGLPNKSGVLALKTDITETEQNAVTYFIENVFSIMSTTDNISHAFFVKDDISYAWHGMYRKSNYASFILHGYDIRTLHLQLNNGVWTYNIMDNQ